MRRIHVLLGIFAIVPVFLLLTAYHGTRHHENSREPDGIWSNTGSPGDGGVTCAECHTDGSVTPQNGWFTSDIPGSGYIAGTTYSVSLTIAGGSASTDKGFSIVCENGSGGDIGTFATAVPNTSVQSGHVSHTSPNPAGTWSMNWTAPATGSGTATFYAALVKNGFTGGVATVQAAFTETFVGIDEANSVESFNVYPNPVVGEMNIELGAVENGPIEVHVYSITGQLVLNENTDVTGSEFKGSFDLSQLSSGTYFVKVTNGNTAYTRKILVK